MRRVKYIIWVFLISALSISILIWPKTYNFDVYTNVPLRLWVPKGDINIVFLTCSGKAYMNGVEGYQWTLDRSAVIELTFSVPSSGCKMQLKWNPHLLVLRVFLVGISVFLLLSLWMLKRQIL